MTIPTHLAGAERNVYVMAADRARAAYRKRTGATALQTIGERRSWLMVHGATMASKADAAGMTAVRKMHTARVVTLETATDPARIGGPATGEHLAILTREADYAAERLAILAPVKAPRKTAKLASVPDVAAAPVESMPEVTRYADTATSALEKMRKPYTWRQLSKDERVALVAELATRADVAPRVERVELASVAPVDVPVAPVAVAPETVPAPMPAMTRAARKATRRELAATMRAAGIKPEGYAWREACRAAGLFAADGSEVSA